MLHPEKIITCIIIIGGLLFLTGLPPSFALDIDVSSSAIRKDISNTIDVEKKIQKKQTAWNDESMALTDTQTSLVDEKKRLQKNLQKLDRLLSMEVKKNQENLRRKEEVERVKNELSTFLESIMEELEIRINRDLPFLNTERQARIDSLKTMMVDPLESSAEKFRRIFEALQIEADYGTTIEATRETITFEGSLILMDIFRLGRVSLFCQTIDKKQSGYFDRSEKTWKPLPKKVNNDMAKAISMARLERSVDLIKLPLGRIVKP